jgi:hypothetical protein
MKLMIVSADPRMTLGYSKVIQRVANYLASKDVEIVMYSLNYRKEDELPNVFIDPRIRLLPVKNPQSFGIDAFRSTVDDEKPDVIFIYSPANVVYNYVNTLDPSHKVVVYLDICQRWSDTLVLTHLKSRIHHWFVFLDCWSKHLVDDLGFDPEKVSVIEHGINFDELRSIECDRPRKEFIVVNMNRNTIRKNWAATLSGFIEFISRHDFDPNIKLYVSCGTSGSDKHCNIEEYVSVEFAKRGLKYMDYAGHFILNSKPLGMTKEELKRVYVESDVGINTCFSEGFGLTSVEHAYFNKPQILTDIPTFRDIFGDDAVFIKPSATIFYTGSNELPGERVIVDYMAVADALEYCYKGKFVVDTRDKVFKRFNWVNVHKQIDRMIDILKDGSV